MITFCVSFDYIRKRNVKHRASINLFEIILDYDERQKEKQKSEMNRSLKLYIVNLSQKKKGENDRITETPVNQKKKIG